MAARFPPSARTKKFRRPRSSAHQNRRTPSSISIALFSLSRGAGIGCFEDRVCEPGDERAGHGRHRDRRRRIALSRRPGGDGRRQRHPGRDRRGPDHAGAARRVEGDGRRTRRRPQRPGDRPRRQALLLQQWRVRLYRKQRHARAARHRAAIIRAGGSSGSTSPPVRWRCSTNRAISAACCAGPTTSCSTTPAASGSPITARSITPSAATTSSGSSTPRPTAAISRK